MADPLLTVVIPTYQRRDDLVRALRSLEQPGWERIEVVISDNASRDGTAEAVRALDLPFAKRYLRNRENIGICRNLYQAAEAVRTRFQLWLTDDDYLLPGAIAKLLAAIDDQPDCHYFFSHIHSLPDGADPTAPPKCLQGPSAASFRIEPGLAAVAEYARYGWTYSRQVLRTARIDWGFWRRHLFNPYTPLLVSGRMMLRYPAYYQAESLVAHTVGNPRFWEEFGEDELSIALRTQAGKRAALRAICEDLPENPDVRRLVADWEHGCAEECMLLLGRPIAAVPVVTAYRALRSAYDATPELARRMVLRSRQRWRQKVGRFRSKSLICRTVRIEQLPYRAA